MPEIGRIIASMAGSIRTSNGKTIKAVFRPPPKTGPDYLIDFQPRHTMVADAHEKITPDTIILDSAGTKFLCMSWHAEDFRITKVGKSYVLFVVNAELPWTRAETTLEPISGLSRANPQRTLLGTIPVSIETLRVAQALQVDTSVWGIITYVPIQVGDFVGDYRIRRTYKNGGLTFGEAA